MQRPGAADADEVEDDFDEIFGLSADDEVVSGLAFDTRQDDPAGSPVTSIFADRPNDRAEPVSAHIAVSAHVDGADDGQHGDGLDHLFDFQGVDTETDPPIDNPWAESDDLTDDVADVAVLDDAADAAGLDDADERDVEAPEQSVAPTDPAPVDDAEISFDDIFPPKVNQPEETVSDPPPRIERNPAVQTFSERDRQRSLFGDGVAPTPRDARDHGPDDGYEHPIPQDKPVARTAPLDEAAPSPAPVTGPPRIEARPSYLPTRQGATSKLQVESSSPLLGRAFGFIQRD